MKKDIEIPVVKDIEIAIIKEYNEEFLADSWYAYLFNNSDQEMEAILVVSQAIGEIDGEVRGTGVFRHAFKSLAPKENVKIELLDESVFKLSNSFMLTFFQGGKLYDKTYTFIQDSLGDAHLQTLPFTTKKGILVK
ncbi:hypothetical protein QK342_05545 [Myroides odoratimimus]|uniref:hypothetical protein n=1 Tax=Myroides odoratimimus TaxID=76832 RepID=UPI0010397481|nr:hypothetical protein [Myroides odoratimimus]MDM1398718.1 hypothetical protein [Myroides odoratimimus]MDM1494544.1 hypothetical protein [Myroides odoratimimus]MDM1527916.1 hypothetical protein [Myroides odoratimimus]QBK75824.1 hypothetical protein E0Z07_05540 [Myroides odoratimimus]WHT74536.1 hypothetical protein QK342_05545 [Myroides odoratimimus]